MINMARFIRKTLLFISVFFIATSLNKAVSFAAGSCNIYISGESTVYVGETISLILSVNNINGANNGLASTEGTLFLSNSNVSLVGFTSLSPFQIGFSGNSFAGSSMDTTTIRSNGNLFSFNLKANSVGSTNISFGNSLFGDSLGESISCNNPEKHITVIPQPSGNANLNSLSTNSGGLSPSFNKDINSYNVNVGNEVSNITIAADVEDPKAVISGAGNKNLNYGNNSFSISVRAENGATKTYIINVNRKDIRSNDATLKFLSFNSETPINFESNVIEYNVSVPFSVTKLDLSYETNHNKSSVSVVGNGDFIAEQVNTVKIIVTAENGSTKEYTINVRRGKDPNKVLSTNNFLKSLKIDVGILSPVFNKEITYYEVWLPFEIEEINISADVEDSQYGKLTTEGPKTLSVGNNRFVLTVTAEDSSGREYIVNVKRAINPLSASSNNTFIKSLDIIEGSLTENFDMHIRNYKYKGDFRFTAIAEDENSSITVIDEGDLKYLIVTAPNGDTAIYSFEKDSTDYFIWIVAFVFVIENILLVGFYIKGFLKFPWEKRRYADKLEGSEDSPSDAS